MRTKSILLSFVILLVFIACSSNRYQHGEILYNNYCAACHMEDGTGLGANIPPLANADFLTNRRGDLACIIRHGITDTIHVNGVTYAEPMAGIKGLTDAEISNILNYIQQAWGNELPAFTMKEIQEGLKKCE